MEEKSPLERVNSENRGNTRSSPPARRSAPKPRSTDELLAVLADSHRRRLVRRLTAGTGAVPLADASAGAVETGVRDDGSFAVALHHVHLPKLTDAGVAAYDREAEAIEAGANAERAVDLLDAVAGERSSDAPVERPSNPLGEFCSTDEAFRLLADETRRFVLSQLDGTAERVHLDDLAERVAARTPEQPVAAATEDERTTAAIELDQRHLPMLSDAGVVEYDRVTKTLPARGHPVAVAEWLAACPVLETFDAADGV